MNTKDIGSNSIDSDIVTWPARRLAIGDSLDNNRLVYQIGQNVLPNIKVVAIYEDRAENTYMICVNHPNIENAEVPWKVIRNPSQTVEIEYDVSKEAHPDESIKE